MKKFRSVYVVALALLWPLSQAVLAAEFNHDEFNGVWRIAEPVHALRAADGSAPPLLPEAQRIYDERRRGLEGGDRMLDRTSWCAAAGLPRLLTEAQPFEIMVDRRQVGFFFQWNRWVRLVDMSGAELELYYPLSMGIPSGKWEGDTLVVRSMGLMHETFMDASGLPHSDNLVMTERLRLRDADTLENHIHFEDPETFTRPWETVLVYKRQHNARLREDVCLDNIKQGLPAI
ncbi:MAG: hypothetical protein H6978_10535 [Gammaproteobacteria bacterium]|nr:hypothetical protein [Gammaproteobacteria bacterium]